MNTLNRTLSVILSIFFMMYLVSCTNNSTSPNNEEIEAEFASTVQFENSGAQAYVVTNIDGEGAFAEMSSNNPELNLTVGGRYTFINNAGASSHPLDLRNADREKLIGQSNNSGLFDSDDDVQFTREGNSMSFTLTQELADELAEYICAFHPGMKGSVEISN